MRVRVRVDITIPLSRGRMVSLGQGKEFGYRSSMNAYQISATGVDISPMTIEIVRPGWRVKGLLKLKTSSSALGYELHQQVGLGKTWSLF